MNNTKNNQLQGATDFSRQQSGRRLPIYEAAMEIAPIVGEQGGLMNVHLTLAAKTRKLDVYRPGSYVKHPPGFEVKPLTDEVYWDDVMRWLPTWLKESAPRLSVELPGIQDDTPIEKGTNAVPRNDDKHEPIQGQANNTPTIIIHRLQGPERKNALSAVIAEAYHHAVDPNDNNSAWAKFVEMASSKNPPPPLVGYVAEGVQWRGPRYRDNLEYDVLTRDAFDKRMKRMRSRQPPPTAANRR